MVEVVVVSLCCSKNIYYLSANNLSLNKGDKVVVETDLGLFLANVVKSNYKEKESNLNLPLKKVIRVATDEDIARDEQYINESFKILDFAKKTSESLQLNMNFIDARYNLDKTVLMILFSADNRVDFRELAKKIAQKYKSRIELRQIGVRDKAKIVGGIGPCGLQLCCNRFLSEFNSVSINMAKNQNLALSPNKINGTCGRLLCCLGYENEVYAELKSNLPKIGLMTDTPEGMGKVVSIDILNQTYTVEIKDKGTFTYKKAMDI